jgi:hypothetical protein
MEDNGEKRGKLMENFLHVYGQQYPHDFVNLSGTRKSLRQLSDYLLKVSMGLTTMPSDPFMDNAGEGFNMLAQIVEDEAQQNDMDSPYEDYEALRKKVRWLENQLLDQ